MRQQSSSGTRGAQQQNFHREAGTIMPASSSNQNPNHLALNRPQTTGNQMRSNNNSASGFTRQGVNTQSSGGIRRGKARNGGNQNNAVPNSYTQKRQLSNNSGGIYGFQSSSNQQNQTLKHNLNRVIAYENGSGAKMGFKGATTTQSNIKEVLNSTAPICISSYIKGNNSGGRPGTKGASRRQASFGHTAGTTGSSSFNQSSGVRRGTVSSNQAANNTASSQNIIGMVSGQTINVGRSSTRDGSNSIVMKSQKPTQIKSALYASSSATPGGFEGVETGGYHQPRLPSGYKTQHYNAVAAAKQAQQFKQYNEEDGFMRGARIAEKIQEFYHTSAIPENVTSGSQTLGPTTATQKSRTGGPSRSDIQSQGGQRANQKIILVGEQPHQQVTGGGKPRATSAYGQGNSRRPLNQAHIAGNAVDRQVISGGAGLQQKGVIGNMNDRKMQMRPVNNSQPKSNNFTGTVFNEPPTKVAGIGHGFGTQRPISRDSRVRQQNQNKQQVGGRQGQESLGATTQTQTQGTNNKHQVNNFFSLASNTNSHTGGLNSSIGNISNAQRKVAQGTDAATPQSNNNLDQKRIQSYLRSSGHQTEMLKIQDIVTTGSQENKMDVTQGMTEQFGQYASGQSNVTSSDIRQIKSYSINMPSLFERRGIAQPIDRCLSCLLSRRQVRSSRCHLGLPLLAREGR